MENLFQDYPREQRLQVLKDNCTKLIENHEYTRPLSDMEMAESKDALVEVSIKIQKNQEELKQISKELKDEIKGLQAVQRETLQELKFKQASEAGTVFAFADQEKGDMLLYDADGRFISLRPLMPDERQMSIFEVKRNGTTD